LTPLLDWSVSADATCEHNSYNLGLQRKNACSGTMNTAPTTVKYMQHSARFMAGHCSVKCLQQPPVKNLSYHNIAAGLLGY